MTILVPTSEPSVIVAGDSHAWTKSIPDYPADQGWVLSYVLMCKGKTPITLTGTPSGSLHAVSLTAASTASWSAAIYRWTAFVSKGTERKTIESGTVEVKPNPATADASTESMTHAERCLSAIEAALEGNLQDPMLEWEINGRKVKNYPLSDLHILRAKYRSEIRIQRGGSALRLIPVRFGHV